MFLRLWYVNQDKKRLDFLHYWEKAEGEVFSRHRSYQTTKTGLSLGRLTPPGFLMIFLLAEFKKKKNVVELLLLIQGRISLFGDSS